MTIILTDEEKQSILAARSKKSEAKSALLEGARILHTAADYLIWLTENNRGSSFSAFVNEFGYENQDAKLMYEAISPIIKTFQDAN